MSGLQWWCSAQGVPWTWRWRPYPGVWTFVALLFALYWGLVYDPAHGPGTRDRRGRRLGAAGILCVWLAVDWPLGALGAGYLASAHMGQYLLLAFVAPPLLVAGLPADTLAALTAALAHRPVLQRVAHALTHPVVGLVGFVAAFLATHAPPVTDGLMATQLGSLALDLTWLGTGVLFWWPVVGCPPGRAPLAPPLTAGYLFVGTLAHTPIAMWLVLASFPVYATYELAPPIRGWLTAQEDQQLAGGLMLTVGGFYVLGAVTVVLYRWMGTGAEPSTSTAPERSLG